MNYFSASSEELTLEKQKLASAYEAITAKRLSLDMSRGKPEKKQLDLSEKMLTVLSSNADCASEDGTDCRNYGIVDGIAEAKKLFADLLEVSTDKVIIGGNSSLNLMYDAVARCMLYGVYGGNGPWVKNEETVFLCPVPGYDRHFGICESLGIKMVNVPMTSVGPDMDMVEELVKNPNVRGIWCNPKYANPSGVTYSDETVRRMAALKPASPDFRIFWDNAYCIHDLYEDRCDTLLNILDECEKAGNPDLAFVFASTSKISYPGAGVSVIASSANNIDHIRGIMKYQTIGHDKLNMLRHVRFFGNAEGLKDYMKKHAEILRPKFDVVLDAMEREIAPCGIASWSKPLGGYFISLEVPDGCAKRTVALCAKAGVKLTGAGAAFPYGKDPRDSNIRIAPSYPPIDDLKAAVEVLCICVKIAAIEKITGDAIL